MGVGKMQLQKLICSTVHSQRMIYSTVYSQEIIYSNVYSQEITYSTVHSYVFKHKDSKWLKWFISLKIHKLLYTNNRVSIYILSTIKFIFFSSQWNPNSHPFKSTELYKTSTFGNMSFHGSITLSSTPPNNRPISVARHTL